MCESEIGLCMTRGSSHAIGRQSSDHQRVRRAEIQGKPVRCREAGEGGEGVR